MIEIPEVEENIQSICFDKGMTNQLKEWYSAFWSPIKYLLNIKILIFKVCNKLLLIELNNFRGV